MSAIDTVVQGLFGENGVADAVSGPVTSVILPAMLFISTVSLGVTLGVRWVKRIRAAV